MAQPLCIRGDIGWLGIAPSGDAVPIHRVASWLLAPSRSVVVVQIEVFDEVAPVAALKSGHTRCLLRLEDDRFGYYCRGALWHQTGFVSSVGKAMRSLAIRVHNSCHRYRTTEGTGHEFTDHTLFLVQPQATRLSDIATRLRRDFGLLDSEDRRRRRHRRLL
jgi:hypothetical protein